MLWETVGSICCCIIQLDRGYFLEDMLTSFQGVSRYKSGIFYGVWFRSFEFLLVSRKISHSCHVGY